MQRRDIERIAHTFVKLQMALSEDRRNVGVIRLAAMMLAPVVCRSGKMEASRFLRLAGVPRRGEPDPDLLALHEDFVEDMGDRTMRVVGESHRS